MTYPDLHSAELAEALERCGLGKDEIDQVLAEAAVEKHRRTLVDARRRFEDGCTPEQIARMQEVVFT